MKKYTKYELTSKQELAVKEFLDGRLSSRECGKILGCSHENVRLIMFYILRQWYKENKWSFNQSFIFNPSHEKP
jgi:hypothetical protein